MRLFGGVSAVCACTVVYCCHTVPISVQPDGHKRHWHGKVVHDRVHLEQEAQLVVRRQKLPPQQRDRLS